jgi:hypothetical protein
VLAKEATMSTLNASWNFLSGIAVHLGADPSSKGDRSATSLLSRRFRKKKRPYRTLDQHERQELIESIRHDDWFE